MLSIEADFDRAYRILSDLGRQQLPFATAMALNDTAQDVKVAEEREIDRAFDRPTPFTRRALYQRRARKTNLTAEIGAKRVQAEYLKLQATGGTRRPKGRALVIPRAARRNKYGNLPKGALSRLKSKGDVFVASRGRKGANHLAPGVYQRTRAGRGRTGGLKMLIGFEPRARYTPRLRFEATALQQARRTFEGHFVRRVKEAIATAR